MPDNLKSKTRILMEQAHLWLEDVDGALFVIVEVNGTDVWRQSLKGMAEKSIRWILDFYPRGDAKPCPKCRGCGKVANTEDMEPWTMWETMPEESKGAVRMGLVCPIECPVCKGTGKKPPEKER